jgi:hypothetical protein
MSPRAVKREGNRFFVWDTISKKYRFAGEIINGVYYSYHKTKCYKWESLGVSINILRILKALNIIQVKFKYGENPPFQWFLTTVQDLLDSTKDMPARNEIGSTKHIPFADMIHLDEKGNTIRQKIEQTKLGGNGLL